MAYRAIISLEDKKQNVIQWQESTKLVRSIKELKDLLNDDPYNIDVSKAKPMYVDTKEGKTKKIGWVRDTWEYYHDTKTRFPASYWIEVQEVTTPEI